MIVKVSTLLETTADLAWRNAKRTATLLHVTRGLLGFRGVGQMPEEWRPGDRVRTRLFFFHVVPAWEHELGVVGMDEARHEFHSAEHGGPVRTWNHRIAVEPVSATRCRYTDEIDIRAGWLTPAVWLFAQVFYRYRQMRWRRLARLLA
jgi:hypothetical protein